MANPVIIDISHWQDDPIDWASVKAGGTYGVIHKATEGMSVVDKKLFSRAAAAMNVGLFWSTYHFLRPGSPRKQMDFYLGTIDPKQGERICLDHEDPGFSLADLEACVQYVREIRPDLLIAIYSGHVIKEQLGNKRSEILASTSLWIAQYTEAKNPTWPTGTWPKWDLWQYTDKSKVSGIKGDIDGDRFNGPSSNIAYWFGAKTPQPDPKPEPVAGSVKINIEATPGTTVTVTVNGSAVSSSTAK